MGLARCPWSRRNRLASYKGETRNNLQQFAIICSNLKASCRDARVARDGKYEGRRSWGTWVTWGTLCRLRSFKRYAPFMIFAHKRLCAVLFVGGTKSAWMLSSPHGANSAVLRCYILHDYHLLSLRIWEQFYKYKTDSEISSPPISIHRGFGHPNSSVN